MKICPMDKDFVLFRCVHFGPLSPSNIEKIDRNIKEIKGVPKEQFDRNKKFFTRLIDTYGTCGMLAKEGDSVVAHARFYPKVICDRFQFCCQVPENAISQQMVEMDLPAIENPAERILTIACFLVHKDYRGQGLTHALLDGILEWARSNNWKAVRAVACPGNYWLASHICMLMLRTYVKHGFKEVKTVSMPEVTKYLIETREGKLGAEIKEEFEEFYAGEDLSKLAVLHEVERNLEI